MKTKHGYICDKYGYTGHTGGRNPKRMKCQPDSVVGTWRIEYEIPPLRAIYHAFADNCTQQEAVESVKTTEPLWRIRKITLEPNTDTNQPPKPPNVAQGERE